MCGLFKQNSTPKIEKAPKPLLETPDAPPEPPVTVRKAPRRANRRNDLRIDLAGGKSQSGLNL